MRRKTGNQAGIAVAGEGDVMCSFIGDRKI